jgi:hypothetical protein
LNTAQSVNLVPDDKGVWSGRQEGQQGLDFDLLKLEGEDLRFDLAWLIFEPALAVGHAPETGEKPEGGVAQPGELLVREYARFDGS